MDRALRCQRCMTTAGVPARTGRARRIPGPLIRLFVVLSLLPLLAVGSVLVFAGVALTGRIYPDVAVGGVSVGWLTTAEAVERVHRHAAGALSQPVRLAVHDSGSPAGAEGVTTSLAQLGMTIVEGGVERAVVTAAAAGREARLEAVSIGRLLARPRDGEHVALPLALNEETARAILVHSATLLDRPAADAHLEIIVQDARYDLRTLKAIRGRRVDVEAALFRLIALAAGGVLDSPSTGAPPVEFELPMIAIESNVADDRLADLRTRIDAIAGMPFTFDGGRASSGSALGVYTLEPAALVGAVRLVGMSTLAYYDAGAAAAGSRPADVELNEVMVAQLIGEVAARADTPMEEPRLMVEGGRVVVRPGKSGSLVDRDAAVRDALSILRAAARGGTVGSGARVVRLQFRTAAPTIAAAAFVPAAAAANARLAVPLTFSYDGQSRVFPTADLAALLVPPDQRTDWQPRLDAERLRVRLGTWLPTWIQRDPLLVVREPALEVRGGRLRIIPGAAGLGFDLDAVSAAAAQRFSALETDRRPVTVQPLMVAPQRTEADVLAASPAAGLVGEPFALYSFAGDWTISPDDLMASLRLTRRAGELVADFDVSALTSRLGPMVRDLQAQAQRLGLRDGSGAMLRIDVRETAETVLAALEAGSRIAPIQWMGAPG